jgi:hypothetical protein
MIGPMQSSAGGCLCSAVRYRVAGPPLYSVICHCNTCRKASAAASVAWLTFERANFKILAGVPKTFRSSPDVLRTFCAVCGSALTYTTELRPNHVDITTVTLNDPALFPPTQEVWTEHRLPWEPPRAHLAQHPRGGSD